MADNGDNVEHDPLAQVLIALSDWVEVETTDHDSFGPRQDARAALIKAYDAWMDGGRG